jgi:hypothetical protein
MREKAEARARESDALRADLAKLKIECPNCGRTNLKQLAWGKACGVYTRASHVHEQVRGVVNTRCADGYREDPIDLGLYDQAETEGGGRSIHK